MYSLDCKYYEAEIDTLNELIDNVIVSGMDPNYEVTKNGVGIGEQAIDFIPF